MKVSRDQQSCCTSWKRTTPRRIQTHDTLSQKQVRYHGPVLYFTIKFVRTCQHFISFMHLNTTSRISDAVNCIMSDYAYRFKNSNREHEIPQKICIITYKYNTINYQLKRTLFITHIVCSIIIFKRNSKLYYYINVENVSIFMHNCN